MFCFCLRSTSRQYNRRKFLRSNLLAMHGSRWVVSKNHFLPSFVWRVRAPELVCIIQLLYEHSRPDDGGGLDRWLR